MEGTAYTRNSVAVAAVCIALALTLSACGDVGLGLLDDPSLSEDLKLIVIMCELVDPSRKTAYKTCLRRFGVLRHGRIPPDGLRSALAAGTSSNGTAVIDFLTVRSKTTGKKLPTWTADLPETLTRVGRREIAVSVNITDEEYRSPRGVPKGMTVTLYAVDKKGKREEVGTRSGKVAKSGAGRVVFKNVVAAGSHHTVEVDFDGGSLFPGVLVYNAANVGKAITRAPARSAGRSSSPASSVLVGPRVELQPRLRQAGSVQRTTTLVTDSFDVKGTTAAGKLPKWKVDIPSTRVKRSAAPRDIAVGLMIAKKQLQSVKLGSERARSRVVRRRQEGKAKEDRHAKGGH